MNFSMQKYGAFPLALTGLMSLGVACGGDEEPPPAADAGFADAGPRDTGVPGDTGVVEQTLYERIGGEAAITAVIGDFVTRVVGDAKINGYFLNAGVNGGRLTTCLVKQVGALTGGPQTYPAEGQGPDADGCRNMTDSHRGLGISQRDFTDLAGHLVAALQAAGVGEADVNVIVTAVTPLADVIVEDANNNATIYQRVGRKPAINAVNADFLRRVLADAKINGYFLNSSLEGGRLGLCLERFLCAATGGPCAYGQEVEAVLDRNNNNMVDADERCRDMVVSHRGLNISTQDYNDLAGHLVDALNGAGVAAADRDLIANALTAPQLVDDVVEAPMNNETLYHRLGRKPAIQTVIAGFVGRVVANPSINGYFLNRGLDASRLSTCLVRQVCGVAGGPCNYGEEVEAEIDRDEDGTVETDEVCRDMTAAHMGMGISTNDYNDLASDLVAVLTGAGVAQADIDAIAGVLTAPAFVSTIVEDPMNNATIYQRIGRKPAVSTVIGNFLTRVLGNARINGYFLNSSVDAARLTTCLVRQVCDVTGGPCVYGLEVEAEIDRDDDGMVEMDESCADMMTVHAGLGISTNDYNDLAMDLVTELTAAGVAQADITAIAGVLTAPAFVSTIVSDPTNDGTVYQRVGRKPAVTVVVNDFINRVLANTEINGFFTIPANRVPRLRTCLVRQVCSIDGPCEYGQEVETEIDTDQDGTVEASEVCRDMMSSHANLRDGANSPITIADFTSLVGNLSMALTAAGVTNTDRDAILNALAPLCRDIVAGGTGCP